MTQRYISLHAYVFRYTSLMRAFRFRINLAHAEASINGIVRENGRRAVVMLQERAAPVMARWEQAGASVFRGELCK